MALSRIGFGLLLTCVGLSAHAEEGMWTVNAFPRALVKDHYGFEVTDKFLKHLQLSSVRFGDGGSGSFVSPNGLVLTNHHVGANCIAKLGQKGRDYHRDGFYAKAEAESLRCPGLELDVLIAIEDVSAEVRGAVAGDAADPAVATGRRERSAVIENRCAEKNAGARCAVVTLYRGGAYHLYRYRRHTDVRLVFSPEFAVAFFGGDHDNFTFPRYDFDVALFRVYENDKPLKTSEYLRWSKNGAREDDLVFTSGHPYSTLRMATRSMLELLRDQVYPMVLVELGRQREVLASFAKSGGEAERSARELSFDVDNMLKAYTGYQAALVDAERFDKRVATETTLKKRLAKHPEALDAWTTIEHATAVQKQISQRLFLLEGRCAFSTMVENPFGAQTFGIARTLVRLADEQTKPDEKRLHEYTDAGRSELELALYSRAPIDSALDEALFASALQRVVTQLGANDPLVKTMLAGKSAAVRAKEIVRGSHLADVAVRRQLVTASAQTAAGDKMLSFARSIDAASRAMRTRHEEEVEGPIEVALGRIARAQLALDGPAMPADATGTLRISYGRIAGYLEGQKVIPPMTVLAGMFFKSQRKNNQPPWQLPQRWVDAKPKLKPLTPMNVASDNDIGGGNSGSPLVNTTGELVGLVFDVNSHALANKFMYDGDLGRAVSVHSAVIVEALRKIYDADSLADELTGVTKAAH